MTDDSAECSPQVAVLRGGALGDFVLTLPAIDALRSASPDHRLLLLAHPGFATLAAPQEVIDHASPALAPLHVPHGVPHASVRAALARVDLLVAYSTDTTGALLKQLQHWVGGRVLFWDPRPPGGGRRHITEHLLEPLVREGMAAGSPAPRITLSAAMTTAAGAGPAPRPRPLVMIHPGSGSPAKCWPAARYIELADALVEAGCEVKFVCGPPEGEQGLQLPGHVVRPAGPLDLALQLSQADLFVGNDSGPGHVAAAVGTSTLSLFGPTDPRIWRPRGHRTRVLVAPDGELPEMMVDCVLGAALALLAPP
jgi:heptosyltransferase III